MVPFFCVRCQEILLDSMKLKSNIARNAALRENVFMMVICVELRIPLFLVGKPGSSKSLAKAIISENLKGKASTRELLRHFKEVSCSQHCSIMHYNNVGFMIRFRYFPTSVVSSPHLRA